MTHSGGNRAARVRATVTRIALAALLAATSCTRHVEAGPSSTAPAATRAPDKSAAAATTAIDAGRDTAKPGPEPQSWFMGEDDIRREMKKARGQVLFVHLWATWCAACLQELRSIDKFARTARGRGAVVFSLSLDNDLRGITRVPAVLHDKAPSLTGFVAHFDDPNQFMPLFSRHWEGTIPALFAYDSAGTLRASLIGELEPRELDSLLDRMIPPSRR